MIYFTSDERTLLFSIIHLDRSIRIVCSTRAKENESSRKMLCRIISTRRIEMYTYDMKISSLKVLMISIDWCEISQYWFLSWFHSMKESRGKQSTRTKLKKVWKEKSINDIHYIDKDVIESKERLTRFCDFVSIDNYDTVKTLSTGNVCFFLSRNIRVISFTEEYTQPSFSNDALHGNMID